MRIDLQPKADLNQASRVRDRESAPASRSRSAGEVNGGKDEAILSLAAGRIQAMAESVIALPEVRSGKIETLQRAIRDGSYQPQPQQVASSMFAELLDRARIR
jgi:flagellar biosynthesis anti-sigma factor FlgM